MPSINLRLTEEEHAALKAWAEDSRRSIQKEAVYRIFTDASELRVPTVTEKQVEAVLGPKEEGGWPVPAEIQDHFRPDFGTKLGKTK